MNNKRITAVVFAALAVFLMATSTWADTTSTAPAGSQPAANDNSLVYEVNAIQGNVRVAPVGTNPMKDEGWQPVKLGEALHAGQTVRVPFRGKLKVTARPADPPTVILFDSGSLVEISELSLKDGVARSRIALGYGQVKAGVAESESRSDMEIQSPTATLSKKGTDIFGMKVRPDGEFSMFLTDRGRGQIQAIQTMSTQLGAMNAMRMRSMTPGQWVTHQMARAIDNVKFDHNISISDVYGVKGVDQLFTMLNDHGIGFLLPAGNSNANLQAQSGETVAKGDENQLGKNPLMQYWGPVRMLNVGDFGVGQGTVPSVFNARFINPQRAAKTAAGLLRPRPFTRR